MIHRRNSSDYYIFLYSKYVVPKNKLIQLILKDNIEQVINKESLKLYLLDL